MRQPWFQSRWVNVAIGLVIGAGAGLAVYLGSQLSGVGLFVLCGTTAGGVAAAVMSGYLRAFQLTELTISVPQFSELRFAVTKNNKQVAWRLFVESATRVSGQPLASDAGLIREALTSLYSLFATTRELLGQTTPSIRTGNRPTVEHLAIAMLNNELRPILSKWHPRLRIWEQENAGRHEAEWPDNADCRAEVAGMQQRLVRYIQGFGELAGIPNVDDVMRGALTDSLSPSSR
jgi:hypothetical protein